MCKWEKQERKADLKYSGIAGSAANKCWKMKLREAIKRLVDDRTSSSCGFFLLSF